LQILPTLLTVVGPVYHTERPSSLNAKLTTRCDDRRAEAQFPSRRFDRTPTCHRHIFSALSARWKQRCDLVLEHSNLRFESILFDSIRYANRFESIRFVKKSAFRFTSCHAVFLAYLLYSLSQKNTPQCTQLKAILCRTSTKNSYAMHTVKITPYLLFEYQCTSSKFIRFPNRIEKIDSVARIELNRSETFFARIGMLYLVL